LTIVPGFLRAYVLSTKITVRTSVSLSIIFAAGLEEELISTFFQLPAYEAVSIRTGYSGFSAYAKPAVVSSC
jgi:hypothetical protein